MRCHTFGFITLQVSMIHFKIFIISDHNTNDNSMQLVESKSNACIIRQYENGMLLHLLILNFAN